MQTFTREEVAKHKSDDSLFLVIDSKVYDLTDFVDAHPGGAAALMAPDVAGQDATEQFYNLHRHAVIQKYKHFQVGTIAGETPKVVDPQAGDLSPVPYAEPTWLVNEFSSPYFNDNHRRFQKAARKWLEENMKEEAIEHEKTDEPPTAELIHKMGLEGVNMNAMRLGPGKHLHGRTLVGGIKGEDFDYFHELILIQELARLGPARGYLDGMLSGMTIGLPPVMNFCNDPKLQQEVIDDCLTGRKWIALAITEAFAGSDVKGIKTTAQLTPDGKHYIVNGHKKWITNGHYAHWFTTAVKTGPNSISVLLIPRTEGVETKIIKTAYSSTAGTAYVTFDNVKVPAGYILGQEGKGFPVIMSNFNHERWFMCCSSIRMCRVITEECFKWASQRKVFGKQLIAEPVIRQKLARMIMLTESAQAWLEQITEQMCQMDYQQQSKLLAGRIALLKTFGTRCETEIADQAVQIFGGRGITKGAMGDRVESHMRTYKFNSILGGAEEILADLGVRQAMKFMPEAKL